MQNQKQSSVGNKHQKTTPSPLPVSTGANTSAADEDETAPSDLFIQEDEMNSWLHYPVDDNSLQTYLYTTDLLYPTPSFSAPVTVAPTYLPPPPPPSVILPSRSSKITPELQSSTVVASNATPNPPEVTPESRASRVSDKPVAVSVGNDGAAGREVETCEMSVTSSPGTSGSGASAGEEPSSQKLPQSTDDRKRKPGNTDDTEIHNEKQSHGGSTSTKRSRSTEVHNLSERRRRDRINEKMKALQELIPHCNKSDKASMLDEAIEYLKSLQMQVQMMSAGCNMVPMMFLGAQNYMPPMAMGMGMNRATFPFPSILPGSSLQCYPVPEFNMTPGSIAGPTANLSAPMMGSLTLDGQNQPPSLNFTDLFQQYHGLHHTRLPFPQNQGGVPPIATKPSSSRGGTNLDRQHQASKPRPTGFNVD